VANIEKTFPQATGKLLTLFPHEKEGVSLASWSSLKAEAEERAAPNLGRYDVTLDDTYRYWMVFEGSTQPTDWDQWVDVIDIYDGKILADDLDPSALAKINQHRRG